MREIKFRGWLPGVSKMTYSHTLDELMNWNTKPKDNGSAIWLQYTGLKDKNGTEIYEGDIVSGGMLRCTGGYSIHNDKTTVHFESGMFKAGSISLNSVSRVCEIIGNIHEHPHLLKEESA